MAAKIDIHTETRSVGYSMSYSDPLN